jgi:hypothetical protein
MRMRPVGANWFHLSGRTDGQPEIKKLIFALRNFAKAPKNEKLAHKKVIKYCIRNRNRNH